MNQVETSHRPEKPDDKQKGDHRSEQGGPDAARPVMQRLILPGQVIPSLIPSLQYFDFLPIRAYLL